MKRGSCQGDFSMNRYLVRKGSGLPPSNNHNPTSKCNFCDIVSDVDQGILILKRTYIANSLF